MMQPFFINLNFNRLLEISLPTIQSVLDMMPELNSIKFNLIAGAFSNAYFSFDINSKSIQMVSMLPPNEMYSVFETTRALLDYHYVIGGNILEEVYTVYMDLELIYKQYPTSYHDRLREALMYKLKCVCQANANRTQYKEDN